MFKKINKKGFTLAELLIVVAIIGVLVAISIPIFTAQLEKARDATTVANLRSAYAEASALMVSEPTSTNAKSGNAEKDGAANVVKVTNVVLPCTDNNADVSKLPFTITLSDLPKDSATVTFTFDVTAGTVSAASS